MEEQTNADVGSEFDQGGANPAALSLASGAFGTLVGLKRGGVPGAIVGGFVGGTTGYLAGAVSQETAQPREGTERDVSPIEIDTEEQSDDESDSQSTVDEDGSGDPDDTQGADSDDEN